MEDAGIIELFWERSERAIVELGEKYGAFCFAVAMNVLSDAEDAEECVNDTWLRAWNAIPPERPRHLRAWLGKITLNLALNRWQKNHASKRYAGLEQVFAELEDCIPSDEDLERQLLASELSRAINSWLGGLRRDERVIFVKRYWYGEAVNELASDCGVSPAKMAKRLYKLRLSLKQALSKEGLL